MTQIWQPVIWQPNQQLDKGKYTITGILGGGGFGSTYTAKDKSGKTFAIKTLNTQQQTNKTIPEFTSLQVNFVNEALRLARCHHPHIVQVYEVVEHQGLMGMVMEYIQGQNLAELLEDNGPMSQQQALKIMEQIGAALTLVHSQELLHRDIKPQNIMLRRSDSSAVLIDFGLARQFAYGQTGTMTNSRTECYAPIEQYKRQGKFGPYTDVYALAATLYYLRTGKNPIPANYQDELKIPLPEPKQHNSQIPAGENAAILKGLELEAAKRPQSVAEWLKLLEDDLSSDKGLDYHRLRDYLKAQEWKAADVETARVMLKVMGVEEEDFWLNFRDNLPGIDRLTVYEILEFSPDQIGGRRGWGANSHLGNFPCTDLRTIDQLWVKYSNGRFGFSVQSRIYRSLLQTGNITDEKFVYPKWQEFINRVGWRKGEERRKREEWLNYSDITFDMKAPSGHLPHLPFLTEVGWTLPTGQGFPILCRVETCGL
ncbi:serine/threonine-protein kinase [Planktothricoides raciborskii]|uniref:Serine/threonine-protein kinase n=1 Tax=Planktothricoides raciborskii GIHE-MW2 TaxID=2792601 RepID=A0AAU8JK60_9CYAN